jgi:diguanylate cyclase (GGDEF)-like protein
VRLAGFVVVTLALLGGGAYLVSRHQNHEVIARLEGMATGIQRTHGWQDQPGWPRLPSASELEHLPEGIDGAIQSLEGILQTLRENQERMAYDELHDPLTHLPNRAFFTRRLDQALALLEGERVSQVAVLFLDLDGFKLINESYDHPFGDRILIASAQRVRMALRGDDFVARLGGDEFGVLLEDLHTMEEAVRVAQRILEDIRKPFDVDGTLLFLTASLGIASTTQVLRGEELLRNADMAMYTAKDRGKNAYAIFNAQMHSEALDRLNLENDLRRGIDRDEFVVYYQPIVSMFDGRVTGLEALIRWQHPERGLLLPEMFINVAKEAGLMNALNQVLFRKSFAQLAAWRAQGLTELRMAVNVSAQTLPEARFWEMFERELSLASVPASAIQIEVVESEMAISIEQTLAAMERLRRMGATISVDDFGTGYSSLAYLKRLPIHCLKIDRTFIKDVLHDRDDAAIVAAMIVMAHVLQLDVVAEGVETAGQFRFLLDQSCEKEIGRAHV